MGRGNPCPIVMKGVYYLVDLVYNGDVLYSDLKLAIFDVSEFNGFKERMLSANFGADKANQFTIDAVTSMGFISPVATNPTSDSTIMQLLKANNRYVDSVYLGLSLTQFNNSYIQGKDGKTIRLSQIGFDTSYPKAIFFDPSVPIIKRGGVGYSLGNAPITVTISEQTWQLSQDFQNESVTGANARALNTFLSTQTPIPIPEVPNPYEPGGDSGEGGGGGNFDDTSDPIPDSSIPTLSSSNTGFTRIYNPTLAQVQDLARYLWTDETVIQTIWNHIKQYFEDPMQAIIGFNLVPCAVPNGGTKNFALMYIDTGVSMTVAANQFVDVDCGTCEISEYFGSALDYSPYTKISCFLPFIGTVQLNTDEVMKTTLQVKYRIDICSGSCVAKILVNENVLYQYSGHCAIPIPFSASDFSAYVSSAISVAKLAIGAAAGGAMSALMADVPNPTQQTHRVVTTSKSDTERNPTTGRQITTGTMRKEVVTDEITEKTNTQASFSGLSPANIANTVGQIMGSKPYVEHSGSFSGNTGYLGVRRPYLIIQRPNMCMPAQYQQLNGFPSMITEDLSSLKGFTRVQQVQLTGMSATNPEQAEILEMLKSGVII